MRRTLPDVLPWVLALVASTAVFGALRFEPGVNEAWAWRSPSGHFYIVTSVALMCLVLGAAAAYVAVRTRNARVVLLALSFISMAGFLAVHGLATPGFILGDGGAAPAQATSEYGSYGQLIATPSAAPMPFYNVTGLSSRLALAASALFLAASAMPWPRLCSDWLVRLRREVRVGWSALIVAYGVVALGAPEVVPTSLASESTFQWAMTVTVVGLSLVAAGRFGAGYRRSTLKVYGAVALGAILLAQAQLSMQFGKTWSGMFWLYHVQLLAGFFAILWGIFTEYAQGRATRSIEALTLSDVVDQLRSGRADSVVSLAAALEARDGYTLGHGERVAALAVLIGQQMRLPAERLRALAAGALLHDVGKIGVPDAILHKAGTLDHDEYDVIKEHPARGAAILKSTFPGRTEYHVIRHHHERWDGGGYPDSLEGPAIPLEARIAAVADVYDALRSNRAYRPAWSTEEALAHMRAEAGQHFDPQCVDAFLVVAHQWESKYVDDAGTYTERRAA